MSLIYMLKLAKSQLFLNESSSNMHFSLGLGYIVLSGKPPQYHWQLLWGTLWKDALDCIWCYNVHYITYKCKDLTVFSMHCITWEMKVTSAFTWSFCGHQDVFVVCTENLTYFSTSFFLFVHQLQKKDLHLTFSLFNLL